MPDRDDDEYVGFGRPPKSGQIRPGERRNPNGRPPKKRPDPETSPESELDRIIESVLGKTIAISENGVRRDVKVIEAIMQRQAADALKGSQVAQRDAIRLHRESEARAAKRVKAAEEAERRRAEERAAEEASWRRYLRELKHTQQKKWTDALAAGRDEPEDPWPHPDDIILGRSGSTYRIRGPFVAESVPFWEEARRIRDYFLREMALAMHEQAPHGIVKIWLAGMVWHDSRLPLRWQIARDIGPVSDPLIAMRLPKLRQLVEKDRAWLRRMDNRTLRTREQYREANALFGPALKVLGYRSLKQFERACEDTQGNPPLPRAARG